MNGRNHIRSTPGKQRPPSVLDYAAPSTRRWLYSTRLALLGVVAASTIAAIQAFIVPPLALVFTDFNGAVPGITQLVLSASGAVAYGLWVAMIIPALLLPLAATYGRRVEHVMVRLLVTTAVLIIGLIVLAMLLPLFSLIQLIA